MRSFGICVLVVLPIFCGNAAAKDPTPYETKNLQYEVQLAQQANYLGFQPPDTQVDGIIDVLFKVVDEDGNGSITPSELVNGLKAAVPGLVCNDGDALALIERIEKTLNVQDPNGELEIGEAKKYVNGAKGIERTIRLRQILSAKINA